MIYIVLIVSIGLSTLGLVRFLSFSWRLKKYKKTKAEITNIIIEKPPGQEEKDEDSLRVLQYYSPEITYQADDLKYYTGNWYTQKDGELPYNIGEKVNIYYNPKKAGSVFSLRQGNDAV